ncbi:hypothetical protein PROFUN_05009 [Planoprotostelium fungivorum]|uniref:Uncharacterized protein n=1 Tax=Planoprotostelium fungivorum TaxID=1890364 RepID=A0A2P6NS37_9EUKA|nr:hypothetical protein PROFUN_05009 [Planoprotostelium fungivorum]
MEEARVANGKGTVNSSGTNCSYSSAYLFRSVAHACRRLPTVGGAAPLDVFFRQYRTKVMERRGGVSLGAILLDMMITQE